MAHRELAQIAASSKSGIPHDREAEQFVVGARIMGVQCDLLPKHLFFGRDLRCINHVLNHLQERGYITENGSENIVRVARYIEHRKWLQHIGEWSRLVECLESVTHCEFMDHYLQVLHNMHLRRQAMEHAEKLLRTAGDIYGDIEELRRLLQQKLELGGTD